MSKQTLMEYIRKIAGLTEGFSKTVNGVQYEIDYNAGDPHKTNDILVKVDGKVVHGFNSLSNDYAYTSAKEYVNELIKKATHKPMPKPELPGVKGESQQIDELKKETLASYVKKATSSTEPNSMSNLSSRAAAKLHVAHYNGPEGDEVDDGEKDDHKSYLRSKGVARAVNKLVKEGIKIDESRMSEVDLIMQELADGTRSIYDTMNNPKTPEEQYAASILSKMYDEVAYTHRLHPDDDFERIEDIMANWIAKDYGINEGVTQMSKEKDALLESVRKIAGLPLSEGWDDDDEDEDVKIAMKDKKQQEFEKKAKKVIGKVDADKDMSRLAKSEKADDDEDDKPAAKPAAKAEAKPAAKKEAKPVAKSGGSFSSIAREVLKKGGGAAAVKAALEKAGVAVPAHLHSRLHALKKGIKLNEVYIITHPQVSTFVLAENAMMNQYQWISTKDEATTLEPVVFETKADAERVNKYLLDYKNQIGVLTTVKLED